MMCSLFLNDQFSAIKTFANLLKCVGIVHMNVWLIYSLYFRCPFKPPLSVEVVGGSIYYTSQILQSMTSPVTQVVKNPPVMQEVEEIRVQSLVWEDTLEEEMATHSSILVWKVPWTEELSRLQSIKSQRVGQDLVTDHTCTWHTRLPTLGIFHQNYVFTPCFRWLALPCNIAGFI